MSQTWMVRAGQGAVHVGSFIDAGVVAIGWSEMGPMPAGVTRETLENRYHRAFADRKPGARSQGLGQVSRFYFEMKIGDAVVTYDPEGRQYFLGTITSGVEEREHELGRCRRVTWSAKVSRDRLSSTTRNTLGSIMTLFLLNQSVAEQLESKCAPIDATVPPPVAGLTGGHGEDDEGTDAIGNEFLEKADQFIEDRIARLGWAEMQQLVAGILRAMGYKTRVAAAGPDRGVDIFASPDGLGLQSPRIFVEVKHRLGTTIGADLVRSFLGGRQDGDRCLYVSTGGFAKDARYEAERANVPITLLTLADLRQLLVDNYDRLDAATTALVPLRRLYWPIE